MMYKANSIRFTERRIDLYRNDYQYDYLEYYQIKHIAFRRCLTKTWSLQIFFALVLLVLAFLIVKYVNDSTGSIGDFFFQLALSWQSVKSSSLVVLISLMTFALYIIINALVPRVHIILFTSKNKYIYDIREISKKNQIESLKTFLNTKIP